jgi:hypothetical protein
MAKAIEESVAHADELAAQDDYQDPATWRRLIEAVSRIVRPITYRIYS